jgi:hypothetical protein
VARASTAADPLQHPSWGADFACANAVLRSRFAAAFEKLLKRLTIIVQGGVIQTVIYPVFPPDADADIAATWLKAHSS